MYNPFSLYGKTILVTGASSGIGKVSALHLINSNAKVIFACRNEERAKKSMEEIPINLKKNADYLNLDLCNFESIINFTNIIKEKYPKIDILMNNAGAAPINFKITEDNFESYIEGNFLGHVLLTYLLMDHMNINSRIINLSSLGHNYCIFNKEIAKRIYDNEYVKNNYFSSVLKRNFLYHTTKLMMIYFTQGLSDYLSRNNISIKTVSLHPGVVNTEFMIFYESNFFTKIIFKAFYPIFVLCTKNVEEGSQTQLYLSYLDYNELVSGRYYADCKFEKISKTAQDKNLGKLFMNYTIEKICERLPQYKKDFEKYLNSDNF
jgi:NAD(P)-dependent dehydrogenase (short-subunit alcohol dehydrogenase family)